jgi:hypothetical protein
VPARDAAGGHKDGTEADVTRAIEWFSCHTVKSSWAGSERKL